MEEAFPLAVGFVDIHKGCIPDGGRADHQINILRRSGGCVAQEEEASAGNSEGGHRPLVHTDPGSRGFADVHVH